MKEKKYLRLLSFRTPGGAGTPRPGEFFDERADEELSEILRHWAAPDASRLSESRLLAAYREQVASRRAPLWRRLLRASVPVPALVAALAVVALLSVAAAVAMRPPLIALEAPSAMSPLLVGPTKIVEVPVPYERIVTRIVYVERKNGQAKDAAADERERQQFAVTGPEREDPSRPAGRRSDGHGTGYFTRVDMADFQPADEMKIRIIKKGTGDEK